MKSKLTLFLAAVICLSGTAAARGDTLELKDGTVLQGKYLGGTADTVRFETSDGMRILAYSEIKDMKVASAPASAPAPAAPAAAPAQVTVPAGTTLLVRMMDSVSS